MPDEISSDTRIRIRLVMALAAAFSLFAGAAGAVTYIYNFRDQVVTSVAQQRSETLRDYPTRKELWQAIGKYNQREDQHYHSLKDQINSVQTSVDKIVVFLRKKL